MITCEVQAYAGPSDAPCAAVIIRGVKDALVRVCRIVGDTEQTVRGGRAMRVYGEGFLVDYDVPLGRQVRYRVTAGSETAEATYRVESPRGWGWITDPYDPARALSVALDDTSGAQIIMRAGALESDSRAAAVETVDIIGSSYPVAVGGRRSRPSGIQLELVTVTAGASITVTAADLTAVVKADGLAAPQSPPGSVSAVSEIQRLLSGIIPVVIGKGVDVDRRVSPLMVYDKGQGARMDAAEDLADTLGAVIRMGSDGAAYVEVPGTDPVWTINGGDDGVLIGVDFEQSIDKLYNECVSSSSGGDSEIMGSYRIDTGPLRWGGPLGHRIVFHDNPLITRVEQAVADARTVLTTKVAKRALPITVQCLNHPGLQSSDPVRIEMPTCHGFRAVTGAVASISRRGTTAGVSQMEVVVNVTMDDFVEAIRG